MADPHGIPGRGHIVGADDMRSVPDSQGRQRQAAVEALVHRPDIALHSLQVGPQAAELATLAADAPVRDLGAGLTDFAETAAAVNELDLVITVDTAVAHLAGALARPVWTLLPFVPDWRWLLDRVDSPWYPTMRLFRQRQPGDWQGVFDHVSVALTALTTDSVRR